MEHEGYMGFYVKITVHQLGGPKNLWDMRGYGLSGVWVTRGSTVTTFIFFSFVIHY